jgi:hypothetical protein
VLAFTDDDCLPARNWLERLAQAWQTADDPEAKPLGGIGGTTLVLGPTPAPAAIRYMKFHHWLETPRTGPDGVEYLLTGNASYLRAAVDAVGGFDAGFRAAGGEDADLGRRIVAAGYRLAHDPSVTVQHQMHPGVRSLLSAAFRYGRGEGFARRRRELRPISAAKLAGAALLRIGGTPFRAVRYHRSAALPWKEAAMLSAVDSLVTLWANLGVLAENREPPERGLL